MIPTSPIASRLASFGACARWALLLGAEAYLVW
jgi:hypothetical protein